MVTTLENPTYLQREFWIKVVQVWFRWGQFSAQQPRLRHLVTSCFLEIFRYFNEKLSTILRNQLTPWLDNIMIHCNTRTINFLRIETKTLDGKMIFLKCWCGRVDLLMSDKYIRDLLGRLRATTLPARWPALPCCDLANISRIKDYYQNVMIMGSTIYSIMTSLKITRTGGQHFF